MIAQKVAEDILAGNRRVAARLITRIEAGDPAIRDTLETLYRGGGRARVVGVTGPPGAGKSTLVDALVTQWRAESRTVAILAVDPSSPISGGAVLGDRVRMGRHAGDEGVLIRSMAARGALGGLADACGDALIVLDALGFDRIVLETVGVGQSEVDVLNHAHGVIVLQTPEGGDGIQSVKAGVLEVADILVVNKADIAGVERMVRYLREMAAQRTPSLPKWEIPIIRTEANRGFGVDDLAAAIEAYLTAFDALPWESRQARAVQQATLRVTALARNLMRRYLENVRHDPQFADLMAATVARRTDPYTAARAVIAQAVERGLPT